MPYVYEIVNNVLQHRNVQISISNLTQAEITGGISEHAVVALGSTNSKPLARRIVSEGDSLNDAPLL